MAPQGSDSPRQKKVIDAGGHAVLLDINEEQGGRGAKDLGERAQFVRADVSSEQGVRDAVHRAVDFMGSLTLAARGYSCPLGRLGVTDRWRRPISNAS